MAVMRYVGCTRWNLPTDPNPGYDKELDPATAIVRREGEDDEQYDFRWSRVADFTDWAQRFENYTNLPIDCDNAEQEAKGLQFAEDVQQELFALEDSFITARPLLDDLDFWAHLDGPRFYTWDSVHPYLKRYATEWRTPCIRHLAAIRRRYLLHASEVKAPVNAIVRTGLLAQMRQDRRLLDTILSDHEVRKAAAPDTTRVVRDVAWMFSCFEHFRKSIDEPETRAPSAAFAEVRWRLLMMRSMIQFTGEYELCHQPFSTFVDVAYIFVALLLKMSGKALGISFKPTALDVDLEFGLNEKDLQLFRNDVLHLGAGWVDKVKAMPQTHAATLRFQPRIRLYTQHLIADLLWMTRAVEKLAEAEGSVHPRIRSAFGHTHFEILIIDGIMRSSKLTILGPVLEVLTAYMQWGSIMLTQFVIVPDTAVTKGLGDPRNIQGFTEFTKGMHDKTIRDLRVLGLPTSGPITRKAWPTNSDKPFIVVHTLDRLLLFRESMMNATSTRHDLGRAKMFVDDIYEVLSTCALLFTDDVFAKYYCNTWPSRKSVWDLLKALSEWHDDIGTHIALHVLPSSQANVCPFERYMSLAPWDAGPETDMTVAYREIHRTVRDGPTQANDREAEFKSMQIG
ncbi:hypothetical protein B0A48_13479 [Cryoendolithus antarcticus]|uniref:Uncharacterized protein n=1 Tax=Cryoendolithus antarcticus TaxID=1507870 RepID=A0A1V8SPG5_9PEZI|nr:hypothetical protein B0A48_13479 [Cryoendolithus antarcticus]